jgi:NAD-dependent deacetylase
MIPPDALLRSQQAASQCDFMLVIGTSAVVQPAAHMPVLAHNSGAVIVEINPESTPLTGYISHHILLGQAGTLMNQLINEVNQIMR